MEEKEDVRNRIKRAVLLWGNMKDCSGMCGK